MAGIYIHIPYCKQACHYCNFHFSTTTKNQGQLLDAIRAEIALRKDFLAGEQVKTIYFGGGTPSLLSVSDLSGIFEQVNTHYRIDPNAEVTIEANPDDLIQTGYLSDLSQTPVNRLSIGIQSFFDEDLEYMNRVHSGKEGIRAIEQSKEAGFENISVDLIYGTPTLTKQNWEKNIQRVCDMSIPHISAYALTVEPHTALDSMIQQGKCQKVDDDDSASHFELMVKHLRDQGYIHYETSNFCQKGFMSQHNSNYWKGEKYLGIGPSAHSYNGGKRQWNLSNNSRYIANVGGSEMFWKEEELSVHDRFNEYIMTSLRTIWGVDLVRLETDFGPEALKLFLGGCQKHLKGGYLEKTGTEIKVSEKGKFLIDRITADLFQLNDDPVQGI